MLKKQIKVAIVGATGYSGLELLRLLHNHPNVTVTSIHNTSNENKKIDQLYPHLKNQLLLNLSKFDANQIMNEADLVFFATSSGVAKTIAEPFIKQDFPVIDLSGDFRLSKSDYEKWYQKKAANSDLLAQATYSLADFHGERSSYMANPGCYATATLLALAPLAQANLLNSDNIVIDAKSGLSGAGKALSNASHFVNANENFSMYKVNQHQHIPEIIQQLQQWQKDISAIQFTTSLMPINRGIFVSSYVKLNQELSEQTIYELYQKTYQDKHFIRVMPMGELPELKQVIGTNYTDIGLTYNPTTGYLTIISVIDNMIKGAVGQAIQNMNLFFDLDETTGLNLIAQYA